MSAKDTWILGIRLSRRDGVTEKVQAVLTKFGCSVKTRLGLHDLEDESSANSGIILLELTGDVNEFMKLEGALLDIEGIEVRKMVFSK